MISRETSNDLEDEDEVFFGPIGHKERCVTVNSDLQDDESFKPMSPLNGEQIAELFKEATAVSIFLKSSSTHQSIDDDENNIFDKENNGICNILSQTFSVTDNSPHLVKESDLKITKSVSSSESVSEENISPQVENSDVIIPATPKRVLKEKNSEDQTITMQFPSPFIGRKARPRQNASKYATSKLPKTDMTLKTRSCFNSVSPCLHHLNILFLCMYLAHILSTFLTQYKTGTLLKRIPRVYPCPSLLKPFSWLSKSSPSKTNAWSWSLPLFSPLTWLHLSRVGHLCLSLHLLVDSQ